jgi:16S rRNA (guanine966-N2)-methyltransferase
VRVIGGEARGRSLRAPSTPTVRPTSDRVREAIFDVLAALDEVEGATVLDCFAGTGALGIEALSRGAAAVTFVDSDREAVAAVEANLVRVGMAGRRDVRVVRAETLGFLAGSRVRYDLALVDPPYRFDRWAELLGRLRAGVAVLESSAPVSVPETFAVHRVYRHGGTLVTVVTEVTPPEPADPGGAGPNEET